jgi:hypothetical protein
VFLAAFFFLLIAKALSIVFSFLTTSISGGISLTRAPTFFGGLPSLTGVFSLFSLSLSADSECLRLLALGLFSILSTDKERFFLNVFFLSQFSKFPIVSKSPKFLRFLRFLCVIPSIFI